MTYKQEFMDRAISLSKEKMQAGEGGPFGAVIVDPVKNEVVAEGWNQVLSMGDPTAHAETQCIRNAAKKVGRDLKGLVLYTSCEPCPMCAGAIYWSHIDKVYYGNTKEQAATIGFGDLDYHVDLRKEPRDRTIIPFEHKPSNAKEAFDMWAAKVDKQQY